MSRHEVLIGIDAGTSVIKAVAFDADGEALASRSRPNSYRTVPGGGVEQDMRRTRDDTLAVLAELIEGQSGLAERVVALAVTGQGDGTWLVDAAGEPVHDAWLWMDGRSAIEATEIEARDGYPLVYERTATGVNVCQMRTQLSWMKRHAPELLARAATAYHCKDWLYAGLTGERATDPSEGVFTFGNNATRDIDETVVEALGLADLRHLIPDVVDGIEHLGSLTAEAAKRTGLPAGLPVALGYVDVVCTALGGGLYSETGTPGLSIVGSTGVHMRLVHSADDIVLNPARSGYTMCFPGGGFTQLQSNMAATLNIDWLLDVAVGAITLAGGDSSREALLPKLEAAISGVTKGQVLYHPFISTAGERGPFTDPEARAGFTGLDTGTGFAEMARAVYEGLALAARDCYDALGERPTEVRLSGGAARSPVLRSLHAAALDRPLRVVERDEAGAAGACMIAATALGLHASLSDCCAVWVDSRLGDAQAPDPLLAARFDALAPVYRRTREVLGDTWHALADLRIEPGSGSTNTPLSDRQDRTAP